MLNPHEGRFVKSIYAAIDSAAWVRETDAAAVAAALTVARRLDYSLDEFRDLAIDTTGRVQKSYYGTILQGCLRHLGFEVDARKELVATPAAADTAPVDLGAFDLENEELLTDSLTRSIEAASWLGSYDEPYKVLAWNFADSIQLATGDFYSDLLDSDQYSKALYSLPNLCRALHEMGLTVEGRRARMGADEKPAVKSVDELKEKRKAKRLAEAQKSYEGYTKLMQGGKRKNAGDAS